MDKTYSIIELLYFCENYKRKNKYELEMPLVFSCGKSNYIIYRLFYLCIKTFLKNFTVKDLQPIKIGGSHLCLDPFYAVDAG